MLAEAVMAKESYSRMPATARHGFIDRLMGGPDLSQLVLEGKHRGFHA